MKIIINIEQELTDEEYDILLEQFDLKDEEDPKRALTIMLKGIYKAQLDTEVMKKAPKFIIKVEEWNYLKEVVKIFL